MYGRHRHPMKRATSAALLLAGLAACQDTPTVPLDEPDDGPVLYNPDWTEASHGRTDPRYPVVFPQDSVNRIDIVMTGAQWQSIST